MIEIERKFLVEPDFVQRLNIEHGISIKQGYICDDKDRSVRIRKTNNFSYITIKSDTNDSGLSRYEFEQIIPNDEVNNLFRLCKNNIIEKTRFKFDFKYHIFEIDIYHNENEGLVLAEIELKDEEEDFKKPEWLGKEVTGDKRYYNLQLSKNPYNGWNKF